MTTTRFLCSNSRGEHYIKHETIIPMNFYAITCANGDSWMELAEDEHDAAQKGVEQCLAKQTTLSDVELINE